MIASPTTEQDPHRRSTTAADFAAQLVNPRLGEADLATLKPLATCQTFEDGQHVFRAGDADIDLFVVESGAIDIYNPADDNRFICTHEPGDFAGDIDLLTRRPVLVSGVARGRTGLIRVPGAKLRELLNKVPALSEKLLVAFQMRRRILEESGVVGLKVVGPGACRDTTVVREFLHKNFVPFTWYDTESPEGRGALVAWGKSPRKTPVIECGSGGAVLVNPSLHDLAESAGVWRECPTGQVDLAIIGAGPAGLAAAVYAASEGIRTVVFDRIGPGGQAGGSSKIENFIGFPSGLSGTELATRGVLQMLKFGARIATPVNVDRLDPPRQPGACGADGDDDCFTLHLDCGARVGAKAILVATGVTWRKLAAEGAERFERAGIYYACTTVEALLHDQQDVAVVGGGNSAGQAVMYLAECCRSRRVHLLVRRTLGPSMSEYLVDRIRATPNITVHEGVEVAKVDGDRRIESIQLKPYAPAGGGNGSPSGSDGGTRTALPVGAVFVFAGAEPSAPWLPDTVVRDDLGYVLTGAEALASGRWPLTGREPCPLETTLPGVLAAGDIRAGSTKRVGFAVGDGSLSVACVHKLFAYANASAARRGA